MLQQDAVRPQMVAGTYSGAAKHNGVGSQEIEIAYAGVMREIDRAVEIVAVANAGIAIDRAAALDDIALANDGRGSNGRPGMDEIHEGRATRLEGRKDLFAQLRFAHAEDKKVIRSGRVVVGCAQIKVAQILEVAGIALPVQKSAEAVVVGKAGSAFHDIAQHPVAFTRRAGIAYDKNSGHVSSAPRLKQNSVR